LSLDANGDPARACREDKGFEGVATKIYLDGSDDRAS
jgi:hypothetical protein